MVEEQVINRVFVYKTNILYPLEYHVREMLSQFKLIEAVDFDFEDCDNILRVEARTNISAEIATLLNSRGFSCKELL